ncbi:Metal-dependent membrane protease, CAAX family [Halanaeroarchaeum sp. HSR-CO]|uniref:CPBP family intramembrane glutamic endopeptidase n=1 Tax=Halanaeroarchaeum sp. HSR-CO TaxID=2866382 RepID=UPI00217DAFE3|nr:CPBP family glutamic-type intramembrane protease [Halanaeroarchaeum sp. HSR-CO]UWG46549.1 Metal-dependent membrane protease, CAAX family [Halanaeroarchaeum sp. HSR-CO]
MGRFVPSVGFVLAGLGVAASLVEWNGVFAADGVGSVPGLVAALVAIVAFGARRYGVEDRRLAILAGVGTGGLAIAAAVTLLYPVEAADSLSVGAGLPVAFVLGIVGVGVAYADWLGLDRQTFVRKGVSSFTALAIGVTGLLVGFVVAIAGLTLLPIEGLVLQQGVSTVLFSLGLGLVAFGFLRMRDLGLDYIDVRWPDRRGWLYVIGGVIGMFAVLAAVSYLSALLGVPSTEHSLIEAARGNPAILLWFIPLSWLAIGPGEELLSRNIVQKYLYEGFSRRSAVLVGTLVFTAIHLPTYATGSAAAIFATLLRLFAISLVLGVVYERTDNVVVAALVHGTYNAIQFGLAYLALTTGVM